MGTSRWQQVSTLKKQTNLKCIFYFILLTLARPFKFLGVRDRRTMSNLCSTIKQGFSIGSLYMCVLLFCSHMLLCKNYAKCKVSMEK